MKYNITMLFLSVLATSALYSKTDAAQNTLHLDTYGCPTAFNRTCVREERDDDTLMHVRDQVTQQTIQIKGILDTLCDSIKGSSLPTKESIARELLLIREFIQTMVQELPRMSYENICRLVSINNKLLENLREQLSTGELCGMCDLDASLFTALAQPTREAPDLVEIVEDITTLQNKINYLKEQVVIVWNLVTSISLAPYIETTTTASNNAWATIKQYKNYTLGAAALLGFAYLFRHDNVTDLITGLVERIPVYSLVMLYLLRQKKDKDVTALAHAWFGKDSYLANSMIQLKTCVGSPKEKKPAVHIIARYDMTLEEQQRWADQNNCAVVKVQKSRDCDFMKNFVEFDDGLFKLPLAVLFSKQVLQDYYALTSRMNGFLQELLNRFVSAKK